MTEPYIEDDGAEFPINNCVQCGQTDYVPSFGEDRIKINKIKSTVPVSYTHLTLPTTPYV